MKKKGTLKLVSTLIAVCMLLSILGGCNGTQNVEKNQSVTTAKSSAESSTETTAKSQESDQPLLTYNVFTFNQGIPAWVEEKDDVMAQYIEKRFKIKVGEVTYLQGMTFKERMNLFIATDEIPDVVHVYGDNVTCPSTGLYAELGDLIKENCPNFLKLAPEDMLKDQLYNGKLYSIGTVGLDGNDFPDDPWAAPNGTWARFMTSESVLSKCGYKFTPIAEINRKINESGQKPTAEMYKIEPEIKTPDDFYAFLKKIKEVMPKVDGKDVIPFTMPIWLEPHFGWSFGLAGTFKLDANTNKVSSFLTDDKSKDYWKFMNKLYTEGLLDKDFAVQKLEQMNEKILQLRAKSFMWSFNNGDVQTALKEVDSNDSLRAVRLPVMPGVNPVGIDHTGRSVHQFFISKEFKEIPRLLKYFDWCLSEEANDLYQWGPEELGLWEMKDGKKVWKSQELYNALMSNNADYLKENYWNKGLGGGTDAIASKVYNGKCAPMMVGYNPYSWKQSYKYQVAADDFATQDGFVSAGGNDVKGYLISGVDDDTSRCVDFIYGEFEQQYSARLFAAKSEAEFDKNWSEIQTYFNEKVGFAKAKKAIELAFKIRGFNVMMD